MKKRRSFCTIKLVIHFTKVEVENNVYKKYVSAFNFSFINRYPWEVDAMRSQESLQSIICNRNGSSIGQTRTFVNRGENQSTFTTLQRQFRMSLSCHI